MESLDGSSKPRLPVLERKVWLPCQHHPVGRAAVDEMQW